MFLKLLNVNLYNIALYDSVYLSFICCQSKFYASIFVSQKLKSNNSFKNLIKTNKLFFS